MDDKLLEARLTAIEKRLNLVEFEDQSGKRQNKFDANKRKNTIHPKDMEEGKLAYVGKYVSDDGGLYTFSGDNIHIKYSLEIDYAEMAKVMEAFSRVERVHILRLLLSKRMTANQIMSILGFKTTGKLYHHLSKLEDLGLLSKKNEYYFIKPKKVGASLLVFAAVERLLMNDEH